MNKTLRKKSVSADTIAGEAAQGKNISKYFTNKGKMMPPAIRRVNLDVTKKMLKELDDAAEELNVSRQAVIKLLVRQALNQHYLAQKAKKYGT
ncbi:MAG TPA: ribbon-helix-helix domain-containing protein [Bdellovibrionota bacterium]|nr:ribbon-helix-helix domain-containing protein [Bdellovibrionota bacterium]